MVVEKLLAVIDWFIPEEIKEYAQYEDFLRARFTLGMLMISVLLNLGLPTMCLLEMSIPETWMASAVFAAIVNCSVYTLACFVFKYTASFFLTGNLYATSAFLTTTVTGAITGGFYASPTLPMLLLTPLFVFLVSGRAASLFWTLMVMAVALFDQWLLSFAQFELMDEHNWRRLRLSGWMMLCISVYLALWFHDLLNRNLQNRIEQEKDRLAYEAAHDSLTGLTNRSTFEKRLAACVDRAKSIEEHALLVVIDLDGFKPINDRIGHHAGDEVLKVISTRLLDTVRRTDTVARLGGDEFAIILEQVNERQEVESKLELVLQRIAEPVLVGGRAVGVTGSLGVARIPQDGYDPELLFQHADAAMYQAKVEHNTVCYFDHECLAAR